jgi:hypothetical protein
MINIVETKISYSNMIPYAMFSFTMFMYSSLHIFYILLQCNVEIILLNHYLTYVAEAINLSLCALSY